MCHKKYVLASYSRSRYHSSQEYIYDPRGIVITHVVVSYNRSIEKGNARARYYHPRCEFVHGKQPVIRKYPNVRISVWGDSELLPKSEWYDCPAEVPFEDSHKYSAKCMICQKRHTLSLCWPDPCYIWSMKACRDCFRLKFFLFFDASVCGWIISFLE